ncbi:MAG TPA: hypothetical protein VLF39_04025 [Candidatus Saccharimonadales bacterium]|nr:hypothetical protein [Candidatus Saccharimonadales bacterium]
MHSEIFSDNPNVAKKVKALTMVGLLSLGATACTTFGSGRGNKVTVCNGLASDITVTTDPSSPNYRSATDPYKLLEYQKLAARGLGIRDHSSPDLYNDDSVNKLGEMECQKDPNDPNSLVLTFDGARLSEACSEEGVPSYVEHPAKQIC